MTQKQLRVFLTRAPAQCSKSTFPKDRGLMGEEYRYTGPRGNSSVRPDAKSLEQIQPLQAALTAFSYPGHQKCW